VTLEALYQQIILDHYRRPRNKRPLKTAAAMVEHENPACGDRIELAVEFEKNGKIREVFFNGEGCAVSTASASMMTQFAKGKSLDDLKRWVDLFIDIMCGGESVEKLEEFGELAALKGVVNYPIRVKCATLAWHALREAISHPAQKEH